MVKQTKTETSGVQSAYQQEDWITMSDTTPSNVDVSNGATIAAQVNAPVMIEMFDSNAQSVNVPANMQDYWLAQGFKLVRAEPRALLNDALVYLQSLQPAMQTFVETALSDGVIDTHEQAAFATVQVAVQRFNEAWSSVVNAVTLLVPLSQGEGIRAVDASGTETLIDPNQIELYRAQGMQIENKDAT